METAADPGGLRAAIIHMLDALTPRQLALIYWHIRAMIS